MHSFIFSQRRDRRMGVMGLDMGALTTARAREFGVNNGSADGRNCFVVEVRMDTAKLTNIVTVPIWRQMRSGQVCPASNVARPVDGSNQSSWF